MSRDRQHPVMRIQASLIGHLTLFGLLLAAPADEPKLWQTYDGYGTEGYGRHIVLVAGDDEYRSEEALPMLAKILAVRHGFRCTVLFPQDPEQPGVIIPSHQTNIPGLEALRTADLMVIATRFRHLPDDQMREIDDYLRSGRPVVGLRTANHGFRIPKESMWHHYDWKYQGDKEGWLGGFGRTVLGTNYGGHHGKHGGESTRGVVAAGKENHELLRGIEAGTIWGPTDVYGVHQPLHGEDIEILVNGQVLAGMNPDDPPAAPGSDGGKDKNDPMQPLAWTLTYRVPEGRKGRVFSTTMGSSTDFVAEGSRRLVVNGIFWCLGMEIPGRTDVDFVDPYEPTDFRNHKTEFWLEKNRQVADHDLKAPLFPEETTAAPPAPYFDTAGGREGRGYDFAGHPVNRFRLYDFHRRQAAWFLEPAHEAPATLPAAPDLDAGDFGHWGKFHKNGYRDRRWNLMDVGPAMCGVFRAGGKTYPRAIAIRLGEDAACSFDTESLAFTHRWEGGFIEFSAGRWGIGNGITPDGRVVEEALSIPRIGKFLGHSIVGDQVYLHWRNADGKEGTLRPILASDGTFQIAENEEIPDAPARYADQSITLTGTVGEPISGSPFAIDRIPVPFQNEFGSMMFLGGHDFFANGDAAVCTMMGDVWRVSGLDETLEKVTWTRIATGLSQALGLSIHDETIHVTCRDRIARLEDRNGDGEIDFYGNFSDAFAVSDGGHDFSVGLQRDANGYLYFVSAKEGVVRVSPDGSSAEALATGLRNCNGLGVDPNGDTVVVSTNQGDWTPASAVFEVRDGDFYGRGAREDGDPIAPAMCYLPRLIDNSTGGQCFVDSEKWGALDGELLTFSFGAGTWQMILRDTSGEADGKRTQGALVPLPGEFASGAHRGRFSPTDGQLYVSGGDGWGNYAITDGSFDRIRYLVDEHNRLPIGWTAHANGLKVEFAHAVDPTSAVPENFFCQTWNYEYSEAYGSMEYSLRQPELPGHDRLAVKSVHLLDGGRTLFVEIPDLEPAMQVQLHANLAAADGEPFVLDFYPTVLWTHPDFASFEGYTASDPEKPRDLALRVRWPIPFSPKVSPTKPGRKIDIEMVSGLQFSPTEFTVKPGELVSLNFRNLDSIPHNWLLAEAGTFEKVGMASSMMLADPEAASKHFAPEMDEVLHYTPMLYHNRRYTLHIEAPTEPGRYPYLCTFPGHWAAMKGEMVVAE